MVRVIDASVAIKWFVEEQGRERALEVLSDILRTPSTFAMPELFHFELVHVFNRLVPKPTDTQIKLLRQLNTFGVQRFSMIPELADEIRYFQKLGLSGYDGSYVGLARLLKGKWITCDAKAHSRIEHLKLSEIL